MASGVGGVGKGFEKYICMKSKELITNRTSGRVKHKLLIWVWNYNMKGRDMV